MDDVALRENARAAIDPEELENLIRVGEAMIEQAKALMKAAEAAIHTSGMLAIEAGQIHRAISLRRAANRRPTGARTDPYETSPTRRPTQRRSLDAQPQPTA